MEKILSNLKITENGTKYSCQKDSYKIDLQDKTGDFMYVSNNDASEKQAFCHLKELKNVTLDFNGSTLLFSGRTVPFIIDKCQNVCRSSGTVCYCCFKSWKYIGYIAGIDIFII